ncbi:MAG: transglycosylase domain-containing protein [Chloroflexi bacterium]|nr:transglycosylase domain-containing protein [Chloroflexota bacterium]
MDDDTASKIEHPDETSIQAPEALEAHGENPATAVEASEPGEPQAESLKVETIEDSANLEPAKPEEPPATDQIEIAESEGNGSPEPGSFSGVEERHPTGTPDQTGGWYGEALPAEPFDAGKTQPVRVKEPVDGAAATQDIPAPGTPSLPDSQSSSTVTERVFPKRRYSGKLVHPPAIDQDGMPLPNRVNEIDPFATRVTPAAYQVSAPRAIGKTPSAASIADTRPLHLRRSSWRKSAGCALRGLIGLLFVAVLLGLAAGSFGVYQYYTIAATLPNVSDLRQKASQFETTRILDRNGNVLYEILDPNAGRRTYVPLDKISPYLIAATLATEDKDFYTHPGFDPLSIIRALYQNYTSSAITSGASTITQQLARALLMTPEERNQRTIQRKAREIVLAAEITRRYSKDEILELYLNENYYGNLAYGIEAAAETYFNTTADKLTLPEAAFLAGLPQAPSVYDIYTNRDQTLNRQKAVLILMYQDSQEKNCIDVSNNRQPVCVSETDVANAAAETESYEFKPPAMDIRYPHWVTYVRSLLEEQFDPQTIYRSGFTVYTTLDPGLQDQAQQIVKDQVDKLADKHVTDGALVAIKPNTGEILAMVGSADFYNDAIAGQVNMAISQTRQPGSAIKPLTYVAAFEKGWTPATLIWDVPTGFPPSGDPNDPRPPYEPTNYDEKFHGPVTVRTALANSYNIPAVKTLNFVGIYGNADNPDQGGLINFAKRLGITSLTRNDYGLSLTLGGGEISLLQLTGAYAVFANDGRLVPPVAITKIVDYNGNVVYEYHPPSGDQVVRPEHAFLISSILSDNNARAPMFGTNSVLNLGFPAAAKTGTTNDFRDNWTMGYTPDLAVGVWVGNADYTPMLDTTGVTGAAPIWAQFMKVAIQSLTGGNPAPFVKPPGVVERVVCAVSGTEPSQWCNSQRSEFFAADQLPPSSANDLWQKATVDTWTGLSASSACGDYTEDKFALNVKDPTAINWIKTAQKGEDWAVSLGFTKPITFAPERACKADDPRPILSFTGLSDGQIITANTLDINGVVDASADFGEYRLDYGVGDNPSEWKTLMEHGTAPIKQPGKIYTWDLKDMPAGRITLRLYLQSSKNTYAVKKIHLDLQVPTPTPTLTVTPSPTATFTLTPTPIPPTNTPVPPTATRVPPTSTPLPPTSTPLPPTATPLPPSATPVTPTATQAPPTNTSAPPTATSSPPTETQTVTAAEAATATPSPTTASPTASPDTPTPTVGT